MSKQEFMDELKIRLVNIPEEERKEALAYYEDYFEDAGEDNEQEVIDSLGSPQKVADQIKAGYRGQNIEDGEFTETGYNTSYDKEDVKELAIRKKKYGIWTILVIIAILILTVTVIIPALGSVLGVVVGIIAAAIGCLFALVIAGIACIVAGALIMVAGIGTFAANPAAGFVLTGVSLIVMGVGVILFVLGVEFARHVIPPTIKWIGKKFNLLLGKIKNKRV